MTEQMTADATATNGNGEKAKRTYNKRSILTFDDPAEVLCLYAILRGDSNVHSGWRSHLTQKVAAFVPAAIDFTKPPPVHVASNK